MHLTLFKQAAPLLRNNFSIFPFQIEERRAETQVQLAFGINDATNDFEQARSMLRYADTTKTGIGIDLEKSELVCVDITTTDYSTINKEMSEISSKFLLKDVGYLECFDGGWHILFRTTQRLESTQLTKHIRLITSAVDIAPTNGHHIIGTASEDAYKTIKDLPDYITNKTTKEVAAI